MTFLETWKKWADDNAEGPAPYVLDADKDSDMFRKLESRGRIDSYSDNQEASHDSNLKASRLNLGLLPYPFIGDLQNARIFVLMANPNAKPSDEYGGGWRKDKHIANLRQDFNGMELPFEALSRQTNAKKYYSNVKDYYWYGRLRLTIERIGKVKGLSREDAIELVAKDLAVIQRSPYWSTGFVDGVEKLPSARLAMEYVRTEVVRRVEEENATLIVARRVRDWNQRNCLSDKLKGNERFIDEANRWGSLNPNTPGGKAILRHFGINA